MHEADGCKLRAWVQAPAYPIVVARSSHPMNTLSLEQAASSRQPRAGSQKAHLQLRHVQVGVQLLAEQQLHLVEVRGVEPRRQHALAGGL